MGIGFSTTLTNMHLRGPGIATSMVAASLHRELSLVSGATTSMSVSTGFKLFLGSLLGVIILLQLVLMVLVYKHRNTSTLRLHQPHVLLVYVAIAAFTTGSCILFIPFNDTSCMLLDFFLVLPITVMGNTLVARSWRVNTLMIAALGIGREDESPNAKRRRIIKLSLMDFLTFVVRLDRTRTWGPSRRASSSYFFDARSLHRKNTTLQLPHRTSSSLRQKVTTMQLTCLAMILTLPQLVVQLCKLCIPSLQSELIYSSCHESSGGEVLRWVGLVLAVIPLVMLIMLSLYTGGLPLLGIYSSSVLQPIGIVVGTAVVAGPSIFLSISLETKVYLQSCIVNSFTCGTCWFVVAQKLILTFQNEREEVNKTMLRVEKKQHLEGIDSEENEKAATAALQIGKVYESYGMIDKCIKIYDDNINLYKFEPRSPGMVLVGGYSAAEIESFTHVDLASVLKLFAAKGKVCGTAHCASDMSTLRKHDPSLNSFAQQASSPERVYTDALDIYERCPSATLLNDRSIVFPIFSGLFLQIKAGKVDLDERILVDKFVKVTKLNRDDVHFIRALAMKGEVNARLGHYKSALSASALLASAYDAETHHESICKAYGSDRAAQALSASILWNRHLGNINEAERLLQFVLEEILPKMDKKNVHNTVMLILPVVKVMKEDGKFEEARQLFENHVCRNFALYFGDDGTTPCLVIFKPIMYLLDVNMYGEDMPNLNEVIEWAAGDDNGVATDSLDGAISFYSLHCLMAQLCLELSRLTNDEANKNKLQQKSITLARKTFDKSIDEENERVRFPMAFGDCEWILTELDNEYKPGTYAVVDSKQQEQSELFQPSV